MKNIFLFAALFVSFNSVQAETIQLSNCDVTFTERIFVAKEYDSKKKVDVVVADERETARQLLTQKGYNVSIIRFVKTDASGRFNDERDLQEGEVFLGGAGSSECINSKCTWQQSFGLLKVQGNNYQPVTFISSFSGKSSDKKLNRDILASRMEYIKKVLPSCEKTSN